MFRAARSLTKARAFKPILTKNQFIIPSSLSAGELNSTSEERISNYYDEGSKTIMDEIGNVTSIHDGIAVDIVIGSVSSEQRK